MKVALREAEREYYNQEIRENKNNLGQFGKPFVALFQTRQVARASPKTQIHLLMKSITFLYLWERRQFVTLQSLPGCTAYQTFPSLLIFVHHVLLTSCWNFRAVTSDDVRKVIMDLPSNEALGYDRIPFFVIRDCLPHVLPTLTALVNLSFASSAFPRALKKSVVVPHLKDGDREVPNNNRPILLLPVLSKVTKKIALNQP